MSAASSLLRLCAAALAIGMPLLATPHLAGAQFGQSSDAYLAPLAPESPTDRQQCRELEAEWLAIREAVEQKHRDCLGRRGREGEAVARGGGCVYDTCMPFHNSSLLGRDDIRKCETAVRAHLDAKRAEEAARRKDAEEQAKRTAERERARTDSSRGSTGQGAREPSAADAAAARRRAEETRLREERQTRDEQEWADARERREALWADVAQNRQLREGALRRLSAGERSNASTIATIIDGTAEAINAAGRAVREAVGSLGSRSTTPTSASDFDLGPSASTERYTRVMDNMLSLGSFYVPFSGIPLSIASQSAGQALALADQLTRTMSDMDNADPRDLERAFATFPQKALGLRPLVAAISDASIGGMVQEKLRANLIDPGVEALAIRARLAVDDGSAARLFTSAPAARTHVEFWSEPRSATTKTVIRDSRGTVLLFDRSGALAHYDAAAQQARYAPSQVEQLVARSDLSARYIAPLTWTRRNTVFVWETQPLGHDIVREQMADWVAGQYAGVLLSPRQDARDKALPRQEREP